MGTHTEHAPMALCLASRALGVTKHCRAARPLVALCASTLPTYSVFEPAQRQVFPTPALRRNNLRRDYPEASSAAIF